VITGCPASCAHRTCLRRASGWSAAQGFVDVMRAEMGALAAQAK
jgi:hypothetical protein